MHNSIKSALMGACSLALVATAAAAENFNIPSGELNEALDAYIKQAGITLMYLPSAVKGVHSNGVAGDLPADRALSRILVGTGFTTRRTASGAMGIYHEQSSDVGQPNSVQLAQATPISKVAIETVTVTSSKLGGGDVQSIPISITALSQEQLTATQTAGGPDLVKQVPNMSFTKTNFSGYSIQLRGIGTQAISVTTDPAVAVSFNDIPFIRNHFFEQEFYDVSQVEVLRGPQGTLYGRNATAGVVNLISAKPTDQFEATASADVGNYQNRRFEGMINVPIVDDWLDVRVAGEWTKRNGYSFNSVTDAPIDGRDLWSGRLSVVWRPIEHTEINLVWEHFSENDDRLRSGKQLCKTDTPPTSIDGAPAGDSQFTIAGVTQLTRSSLSQGCMPTSLYSPDAFEVPYGFSLPYVAAAAIAGALVGGVDPYASTTQSQNLRVIESSVNPHYQAKNDTVELNADYAVTPSLTFTTQTGYNQDFLYSAEDYNRFNTTAGIFLPSTESGSVPDTISADGVFCDPQVGCANRFVAEDLSDEHSWQLNQEFRLTSNFNGPLNFSAGGNYLHYETEENYYVFINGLTLFSIYEGDFVGAHAPYVPGVTDNQDCLHNGQGPAPGGYQNPNPILGGGEPTQTCIYIDPHPIGSVNNKGHNYFLSQNPYTLNSYAAFGEVNYNVAENLKLIGGLRWTADRKHFTDIPSEVITEGYGYPVTGIIDQQWDEVTGRAVINWTPELSFTDHTLLYGSYSRGYKAGGANPPGAVFSVLPQGDAQQVAFPIHPFTFKPEFINAFELGSKNTALDGALTLNGDIFYYDYKDYQISEIVDRTSINLNFDTTVKGAELEVTWEPAPGVRFNFAGGYEDTRVANGQSAVDLMDRTAGTPGWIVVKPIVTEASNCILPTYVVAALLEGVPNGFACGLAYEQHVDPVTDFSYVPNPTQINPNSGFGGSQFIPPGYLGFDPSTAPNNGEGFSKNLSGNELPNAPPFTVSVGAQYTLPITTDWAGTLRGDYYWQDYSWARIFNDNPYDRIRGYTNVNLTLIFTNQGGWQVMLYDKNIFNTTAITGDFLNSDDSGLTTNIFLTDPRLIGVRVTKNW